MAWIVALLFIFYSTVWTSSSTEVLKPGALVAPIGRVLIVEDVVTVKYDHHGLLNIPAQMRAVTRNLEAAMVTLKDLGQQQDLSQPIEPTIMLQNIRMKTLLKTMMQSERQFPTSHADVGKKVRAQSREKRGLFNFVGLISSTLFGTATAKDVAKLSKRMNMVTQAVIKQNRAISQTFDAIQSLESKINAIIDETNHLARIVQDLTRSVPTLEWIMLFSEYLHAAETSAQPLIATNIMLIADLVNAGLGRVDAQLLPVNNLLAALQIAKENYQLTPIFQEHEVEYYYPLLEAMLTHDAILVHIPMLSTHKFNAWHLEPLPMQSNDTLLTLDKKTELLLVSHDSSIVAVEDQEVLTHCKSSYLHLHVCPAYAFAFIPAAEATCELAIIQTDATAALRQCSYTPIATRPVFHTHLLNVQYFYFPEETSVIVICLGDGKHVLVHGYYMSPDYCEITTSSLKTLPAHQHFALNLNLSSEIVHMEPIFNITFSKLNIVSDKLKFLSYINETKFTKLNSSFPFYLSSGFIIPGFVIPTILIVLSLLLVFCYYKKVSSNFTVVHTAKFRKALRAKLTDIQPTVADSSA